MSKNNNLSKLEFSKVNAEFKNGQQMFVSRFKGKLKRADIINKLNEMAKDLNKKGVNAYLGASAYYDTPSAFLPTLYRHCSKPQTLFNPNDSDTTNGYKNITGAMFHVIVLPQNKQLEQKMHTVKKADTHSFFDQHKKNKK